MIFMTITIKKWLNSCLLPFPKKGNFGIIKNYSGITLTTIDTRLYNALLLNCIQPKIEKMLWKNQNGVERNRSSTSQILTIH